MDLLILALPLWLLGLFLAGDTEATLTQPSSSSASLGNGVQLSCTLASDSITAYTVIWFQHRPPSPPKVLLSYKDASNQPKVTGRFSASSDASSNTWHLTISGVEAKDDGDYYCMISKGGEYVFGGGTQLTVTGGPPSPPTVNLYCPSKEEMASKGTGTLVCSITGFYPSAMLTTWEADGTPISNGVQTTKPIKDNGEYMASSYLPVTAREWQSNKDYSCKVRHEGQDYKKSVSQSQCP